MYHFRIPRLATALGLSLAVAGFAACEENDDGPFDLDDASNAEIVAVAMALNSGEVSTSEPVVTRAVAEAVQNFAEMMVTGHTQANVELTALGIAPDENELSEHLTAMVAAIAEDLEDTPDPQLDLAYIQAQINLHETALEILEEILIPQVDSAALLAELQQMRTAVLEHLAQAETIKAAID